MDYFYVGNHARSVGLNDAYLGISHKKNKVKAKLSTHFFLANADVASPTNIAMSKFLGTELDFTLGLKLNEMTNLGLGYSHLFGTETMQALKGGENGTVNNFIWAVVTVRPSYTFGKNQ